MAEKHEFMTLLRASLADAVILLTTFLVVVFRDLTEGYPRGLHGRRAALSSADGAGRRSRVRPPARLR
jgi:hypothetical protein